MTKDTIGLQSEIRVKSSVVPCSLLPLRTQCKLLSLLGSPYPPLLQATSHLTPASQVNASFAGLGLKVISSVKSLLI